MERHVTIVGAGAMGHGLAVHFSVSGWDVTLVDHRRANLERARDRIETVTAFLHDRELTGASPADALDRIEFTLDLRAAVASSGFVVETISEELDAKRALFEELAPVAPDDAILASNTSSLSITDIAEAAPDRADRIVGCHWWFPPYLLEPVEVVRGAETSETTVDRLCERLESVDRTPIVVERDVPGFVWNRVQFAVVRECLHIVESGIASPEAVNEAIRDGYARRTAAVGPLETIDLAGLELFATIADELYPELATDDEPQACFEEYVEAGRTGLEAGAGFFEYDDDPEDVTRRRDERIAAITRALDSR